MKKLSLIGIRNIQNRVKSILALLGIILILVISLISCYSVKYVTSEVPDLELTPIAAPSIPQDSESWNNQEFVDMVNYSLKLEIQLDAYKQYVKNLGDKK